MLGLLLFGANDANAQDQHNSMIWKNPMYVNPALTGRIYGNYRFNYMHRRQWGTGTSVYQSQVLSYDMKFGEGQKGLEKWKDQYLGVGLSYYSDKAGDLNFGKSTGNLYLAYSRKLAKEHDIAAGLSVGFAKYRFDEENAIWDNQWTTGVNTDIGDYSRYDQMLVGNASVGLAYTYFSDKRNVFGDEQLMIRVGLSYSNILRAKQSQFYQPQQGQYRRLNVHAEAFIAPSGLNGNALQPYIFFSNQGPSIESVMGLRYRHRLKAGEKVEKWAGKNGNVGKLVAESAFTIGAFYRVDGSVIGTIGLEVWNIALSFGYDKNLSKQNYSSSFDSLELSLTYFIRRQLYRSSWSKAIYNLNRKTR